MLMTQQGQTSFRRHSRHASSSSSLPLKQIRSLSASGLVLLILIQPSAQGEDNQPRSRGPKTSVTTAKKKKTTEKKQSIEEKTKIHRLSSNQRADYDAFVYVNRIPEKPEEGESAKDLAGRIFGRLANQEGRILLKLPPGMNRESYLGFK